MPPAYPSKTLPRLALGAVAASLVTAALQPPAQAQTRGMPFLQAVRDLGINAATTLNNSYGLGFEASGVVAGAATFSTAGNPRSTTNSGTAILSAMVSFDGGSAGVLSAVSGLSGMVATAGTDSFINRLNANIYMSGATGTPNFNPTPLLSGLTVTGGGSSSTAAASVVGTNVGTERLQVTGGLSERVINELNNGTSTPNLDMQLTSF